MRLIDADKTKATLRGNLKENNGLIAQLLEGAIVRLIDNQPTAFYLGEVIEALQINEEFYRDMVDDEYYEGRYDTFVDAIRIVKEVGTNEL